jgi:putative GTP pyrophosphokinase
MREISAGMNKEKILGVDLDGFLKNHDLVRVDFEKTRLKAEQLNAIAKDHESKRHQLTQVANYVSNMLQQVKEVHSVKTRLKSADGLVAKIIRKRIESPDRIIELANYESQITDLIGVRALHLFKDQWKPILDYARSQGNEVEPPIAYYRAGDSEEMLDAFRASGLKTVVRDVGYRSVHQVISCGMGKKTHPVEIQIRTVFEEGWAEIDHIVRYPRKTDNPELAGFLKLFNSFAGTADDMGTYLMTLRAWLIDHKESVEREKTRADRLEVQVGMLQMDEGVRKKMQEEIAALRKAASVATPPLFVSTNTSGPGFASSLSSLLGESVKSGSVLSISESLKNTSAFSIGESLKNTSAFSIGESMKNASVLSIGDSMKNASTLSFVSTTKSCPNGHVLYLAPDRISLGGTVCPTCGVTVY